LPHRWQPQRQRQERQRRHQSHTTVARYQRIASRRADGAVLELERCAPRRTDAGGPPPRPKLRPFGPPLPKTQPADGWLAGAAEDDELGSIWREAAAAAAASGDGADGQEHGHGNGEAECVYDLYEPVGGEAEGEDGATRAAAYECEELLWVEPLDELLDDPLEQSDGSDSQGEVDYPEDEGGSAAGWSSDD